jgi:hypothetical protein
LRIVKRFLPDAPQSNAQAAQIATEDELFSQTALFD